jgi:NAD-dependent SIR2 family protein deacetylase
MSEIANISEFCEAIAKSNPIFFCGAGISMAAPSGLPLAKDLINSFYKSLTSDPEMESLASELPSSVLDTLRSPELIYNAVSEYALQIVPKLFQAALYCDHPNINHWILAQLIKSRFVEQIITTNFDQLNSFKIRR